jgi:hypothetical protein
LPAGTGQQSRDLDKYQGAMKPENTDEPRDSFNHENCLGSIKDEKLVLTSGFF